MLLNTLETINLYENRDIFRFPPRDLPIQSRLMIDTLITGVQYMQAIVEANKRDIKTDDSN